MAGSSGNRCIVSMQMGSALRASSYAESTAISVPRYAVRAAGRVEEAASAVEDVYRKSVASPISKES
jgi:hypothetical protein